MSAARARLRLAGHDSPATLCKRGERLGGDRGRRRRRHARGPGRAADPPRGARARARRRALGRRQPLRDAGQGLRGAPAAADRHRVADDLPAARPARRRQARSEADRSLRRRRSARRDRLRSRRDVRVGGAARWRGAGGDRRMGADAGLAQIAPDARAARARIPRFADPGRARRLGAPRGQRAPLRAHERLRRRLSDRRPDRTGTRCRRQRPRACPCSDPAPADRGRAQRQHLPSGRGAYLIARRADRHRDRRRSAGSTRRRRRPRPRRSLDLSSCHGRARGRARGAGRGARREPAQRPAR